VKKKLQSLSKMINTGPTELIKISINKLDKKSLTELPEKLGYFYSGNDQLTGFYSRSGLYLGSIEQIKNCDVEWPVISDGKTWENMGHKRNRIREIVRLDLNRLESLRKGERLETKTIGFY